MAQNDLQNLLTFISESPTCFHAAANIRSILEDQGYEFLPEGQRWKPEPGKKYYTTRNGSSVIAFRVPARPFHGFMICASHSDSPAFKVKDHAETVASGQYVQLNTEKYGGLIISTWMDRPLSIAGRVMVRRDGNIVTRLVDLKETAVVIPNLAPHINPKINDGYVFNLQTDMMPLYGDANARGGFLKRIAAAAGAEEEDILGTDLFLYNKTAPAIWGERGEYISSPKLDDLECAYTTLQGFLRAKEAASMPVYCCFDNEEVGSRTKQGADSTLLYDVLRRVSAALGMDEEDYLAALPASFMVSADNAHGTHPNHVDKCDPTNHCYLGGGVVVKNAANQKYTTDSVSAAIFKEICRRAEVPFQTFFNRSDLPGGSTLGNISNAHVSLNTVDIGLAQLAMHSCYETAGSADVDYMIRAITEFYSHALAADSEGGYEIL